MRLGRGEGGAEEEGEDGERMRGGGVWHNDCEEAHIPWKTLNISNLLISTVWRY